MRAKFGRDPMAGSKKVTLKFIIGLYCRSVQLFIIIIIAGQTYVEECARTIGVAYSVSSTNLPLKEHASVLGCPLANWRVAGLAIW